MKLTPRECILLCILTLCWGFNWPILKVGVHDFPPLTFRTLSMFGALPSLWLVARFQGLTLSLPRDTWNDMVKLALPNVLIWNGFMILAVKMLTSGRAAILGYTMPAWAVLCGLILYGDRPPRIAWLGVGCALGGSLLLVSGEISAFSGNPLGTLLAIAAAAAWGYGTVMMKRARILVPTIVLTWWMLAVSVPGLAIVAIALEHDQWTKPGLATWCAIGYNAVVVLCLAQTIWFNLARSLPPIVSSLAIMLIPVIGVFGGAWLLDETLHWQDWASMLLILAAMATVLLQRKPGRSD